MKKKTTEDKKKAAISPEPKFDLVDLARVNKRAIVSAGSSYFPSMGTNVPLMKIKSFDKAIAGLVGGNGFRDLVEDIKRDIEKGWRDFSFHAPSDCRGKLPEPTKVLDALNELAKSAPGCGGEAIVKIYQRAGCAYKKANALLSEIRKDREKQFRESRDLSPDNMGHGVMSYRNALERATHFMPEKDYFSLTGKPAHMRANACGLHQNGTLILYGEWGMGKTHSLCDLAKRQGEQGLPVLLVLAKNLNLGLDSSPGDALALHTRLADDFDGLLRRLNTLGRETKVRALLLVDGINEKNPNKVWERELRKIIKRVRDFPFVGLVVSYRVPFRCGLSKSELLETPCMRHEGFREIPLKAQAEFLKYYDVPLLEIPPMAEEFTRPLTLKIICETFRDLPKKEQRKGFDGIASGQKGMTYILEQYIKKQAAAVADKHRALSLSTKDIWSLLDEVMAPHMAKNLVEDVPAALLLEKMRDCFSVNLLKAKRILRDMSQAGVVIIQRGIPWEWRERISGGAPTKQLRWRILVRMPYQRFGDHLIARELLKHLKTESACAVRRSFCADTPLARAFTLEKDGHEFRPTNCLVGSGPAEALILEFPERVKNTPGISDKERELLFYLPHWREKIDAYYAPFLDGLYWRANDAFSCQTEKLICAYLSGWKKSVMRDLDRVYHSGEHSIVDVLLSLACRRDSPIPACRLYGRIKSMNMSDRDVFWGTAAQEARLGGWTHNLFIWLSALEDNGFEKISADTARNYVVLLSLFLGVVDCPLRDKATKALVAIGESFPAILFLHALDTLDFDDIYYPERMLAACYGVSMARWSDPDAEEFHSEFPEFARAIARNIFMPGGRLLTHHALVRDYALGIMDIARRLGVQFSKNEEENMSPPFPFVSSPFLAASEIDEKELCVVDFALRMDFKNYTIGGLATNRRNYDDSHKEYADILRQIKWRIKDLGCVESKFKERDKSIAQKNNWHPNYGPVDRYGKKYSWIAYYEMHGWLHAHGWKMSEWCDPKRPINSSIDPSFPIPSQGWDTEFKPLPMGRDDLHWIAHGPSPDYSHILEASELGGVWVMLEGFTIHKNKDQSRELYSFLRGLLVREDNIPRLQKALQESEYPGNEPGLGNDHYIFAGEIPWSSDFMRKQDDICEKKAFDAVPVETIAFTYAWESHHSKENQFSDVYFPAPNICAKLYLSRRGRGVGLFDKRGCPASMYHADKSRLGGSVDHSQDEFQFLHLRKDLLDEYLRATGKRLVWIVWGERRLLQRDWAHAKPWPPEVETAMDNHLHIHKRLVVYPLNKG